MYSLNNDNDSVDYDFFDGEDGQIKKLGENNYKDCSQVITKAIIETHPLISNDLINSIGPDFNTKQNDISSDSTNILGLTSDCVPIVSPYFGKSIKESPNLEKNPSNCLAYVDEIILGNTSASYLFDDKECSDNSLSDSTITTITSELTSVSPCSLMSDTSFTFEENTDSSTSQNEDNCIEKRKILNVEQTQDCIRPHSTPVLLENKVDGYCENSVPIENKFHINLCCAESACENEILKKDVKGNAHYEEDCNNLTILEKDLKGISISSRSGSTELSVHKSTLCKGPSKIKIRRKESNLTFTREELIKIERDNLILLKKIMSHSKPRSVSLNHTFNHRKTSAAINRAKQQKKIEQDNYILYSKISAVGRMKKVY